MLATVATMPDVRDPRVLARTEKLKESKLLVTMQRHANSGVNLLFRQVNAQIRPVPRKPHKNRNQEVHLLLFEQRPEFLKLPKDGLSLCRIGLLPSIPVDHLLRRRNKQRKGQTKTLNGNEHEVRIISNLALVVGLDVERKRDGCPDQLAQFTETKPNSGC